MGCCLSPHNKHPRADGTTEWTGTGCARRPRFIIHYRKRSRSRSPTLSNSSVPWGGAAASTQTAPAGIAGPMSEIASSTCSLEVAHAALLQKQAPRSSTPGELDTHPNELSVWFYSRDRQIHRLPGKGGMRAPRFLGATSVSKEVTASHAQTQKAANENDSVGQRG